MKKTISQLVFLLLATILIFPFSSFAQQDSDDPFGPDSVFLTGFGSYVFDSTLTGKAKVALNFVNDETLSGLSVPLIWTDQVMIDSISLTGGRVDFASGKIIRIDSTERKLCISIVAVEDGYIPLGRGLLANLYFSVLDTGLLILDTTRVSYELGELYLRFDLVEAMSFIPTYVKGQFHLTPTDEAGDINQDSIRNLSDAIHLANYILKGGPPPSCYNCSDVDADCGLSIADVIRIARYIFYGVPIPWMGCVSNP